MAGVTSGQAPTAALVAVGSELLQLGRVDTNTPYISDLLQRHGLAVSCTTVVGDDWDHLVDALRHAHERAHLVVCTGGLGPTDDDRTRDAAAHVLGLTMHESGEVVTAIRERFEARGLVMPQINRRQALVPEGAAIVPNGRGTAPGLWIPAGDKAIVLLPGPPREMQPMLDHVVAEHITPRWGRGHTAQRALVVAGRSESWVDERVQPLYVPWLREPLSIQTTILASLGAVELHLSAHGPDAAVLATRLDAAVVALADVLGADVVSTAGRSLEQTVGDKLRGRGWRVAVAESCTGGLVTSRLTDVAGSSDYVDRAVVAYSNDAKIAELDVPAALIDGHGAVSELVAAAMADGLRRKAAVDVAVAVTGIAGPGGGTVDKPVGTVCLSVSGPHGTVTRTARFTGERIVVKSLSAT
ncbi:MAG: CinA family nicotinamide mononucleotide deamidase-related protein, partial [Acidobacteriota bacterium]